jgi:hypothetical protein
MAEKSNVNLYIVSIIAIVAIVGMVMMFVPKNFGENEQQIVYSQESIDEKADMAGQAISGLVKPAIKPVPTTSYVSFLNLNEIYTYHTNNSEIVPMFYFDSGIKACNDLKCSKIQKYYTGKWVDTKIPCGEKIFLNMTNNISGCNSPLSEIATCFSRNYFDSLDYGKEVVVTSDNSSISNIYSGTYYEFKITNYSKSTKQIFLNVNFHWNNFVMGTGGEWLKEGDILHYSIIMQDNSTAVKSIFVDKVVFMNVGHEIAVARLLLLGDSFFTTYRAVCSNTAVPSIN